jgi:uncharacterized protein YndB with AHSA1/START domain
VRALGVSPDRGLVDDERKEDPEAMGAIELDVTRVVRAPVHEVFDRLADIEGYNTWMPSKGSMRRHTQQTSSGEPGLGTTYVDKTLAGTIPGEIVEFDRPTRLGYHWWSSTKGGRVHMEGWPGYSLEAQDDGTTLVRHEARMNTHGLYRLATPGMRWMATRERTATIDALQKSFETQT